jgi:hypothetical protein
MPVEAFEGTPEEARQDFLELAQQVADGYSPPTTATINAVAQKAGEIPAGVTPKQSLLATAEIIRKLSRRGAAVNCCHGPATHPAG